MTQIIGGLTGIASAVLGGNAGKKASKKAQKAQDAAYNTASTATAANRDAVSKLYDPYESVGTTAVPMLNSALGAGQLTKAFGADDFQQDPGYQFRKAEAQKAIDRRAGANGQYFAPATLKALSDYAGNQASQEYQSAYERYNQNQSNLYSRLLGLSQFGLNATGDEANNLTGSTDALNRLTLGKAGADAQAITDRGAITARQWTDGLKSAGTLFNGLNDSGGITKALTSIFA